MARRREEISQRKLNTIRGVENHDRLDDSLYDDYETTPEKKVGCLHVCA